MPRKPSSLTRYFLPYLMRYKYRIFFVALLLIGAKVASVFAPVFLKNIVDYLQQSVGDVPTLEILGVLLGVYFVTRLLSVVLSELKDFLFSRVEAKITREAARDVFAHLISLSLDFHMMKKTGTLAGQIQRGIGAIEFVFRFSLFNVIPTILEFVLILGILFTLYQPVFGLVTLATVGIYMAYTIWIVERRSERQRDYLQKVNTANAHNIDSMINIETVQFFSNETFEVQNYDAKLSEVETASVQTKNYLYLTNLGQGVIIALGMTAMLALASVNVMDSTMTLGDFTLIAAFLGQISIPLSFIGFVYRQIKESLINMEDMFKLLDIKPSLKESANPEGIIDFTESIVFQDVTFAYNEERDVLHKLSCTIPKGKMIALVGPSGSGKSTISTLLMRFYDPQKGTISIDGKNIANLAFGSYRKLIGIVPQDPVMFNDTILYNIQYGRPDAPMEDVIESAKKAHIHELIESLPQKYQTIVGERGLRLSGGEKQRLAIARVLLKASPILVFDEATSSLDSKAEAVIQESIKELSQEKTLIVIAHRLSTIAEADEIIVLEKGRIKEQGTHQELLKNKGLYHKLWTLQQKEQEHQEIAENLVSS